MADAFKENISQQAQYLLEYGGCFSDTGSDTQVLIDSAAAWSSFMGQPQHLV